MQWVVLLRRDVRQRDETEHFAQFEEGVHSDQELEEAAFDTLVIFQLVETRLELIVVERGDEEARETMKGDGHAPNVFTGRHADDR